MYARLSKIYAALIWCYVLFLGIIWFLSAVTPEKAVLLRIFSSAVSDIVWLPLGIVVWVYAVFLTLRRAGCRNSFAALCGVALVVPLVILNHHAAFRFLFVPLAVSVISMIVSLLRSQTRTYLVERFIPGMVVIAILTVYYQSQLLPSFPTKKNGTTFTVMTYNILGFAQEERRRNVFKTILEVKPDILFCTEFNPRTDPESFARKLGDLYPYHVSNRDETCWRTGEVIYSRFPLTARPSPTLLTDNHLIADVIIDGRSLCLANLHLTRVGRHTAIDTLDTWMKKAVMMTKYENINDRRKNEQGRKIFKKLLAVDKPVLICGDFNDTPNGKICRLFGSAFSNVFAEKGWGLGSTYGEAAIRYELPRILLFRLLAKDIIRIDHMFTGDGITTCSVRVIEDAEGSDHKPLVAEFVLPRYGDVQE